jgi:hypothetical protein
MTKANIPVFYKLSKDDTLIHDQGEIMDEYQRKFVEAGATVTRIDVQIDQLRERLRER